MQVTVKTLRHYEQKGLLLPDEVDEWTGYRYYSIDQMQRLQAIRDLQRLGFTLDEIKELYQDDSHIPSIRQLDTKIKETEARLQQLIARRERLLDWRNSRKEMKTMEKFSIQSLPEIIVASHREQIPNYAALGPLCVNKIASEMQRLGCKCPPPGYCFTIEHNKEFKPTDIDIEYCEQVDEMGMKHIGPYERFYESYTEAFCYLEEQGYKIAGHPRTCYVDGAWNQEDPEKWLSIIQIPIE